MLVSEFGGHELHAFFQDLSPSYPHHDIIDDGGKNDSDNQEQNKVLDATGDKGGKEHRSQGTEDKRRDIFGVRLYLVCLRVQVSI